MFAFFIAFLSGVLTILAPCVFPLLPVIIGSSSTQKNYKKLLGIILGLTCSIFLFTLILRTTIRFNPLFSGLTDAFWAIVSGGIIVIFGLFSLFPQIWDKISLKFKLQSKSDQLLETSSNNESIYAPVLIGASLGPVFSSCSPTYFVIVGLLTAEGSFWRGIFLLLTYLVGLGLVMFLIGLLGSKLTKKLGFASNPNGIFKKIVGLVLIFVGVSIMFRFDKQFETLLINTGIYDGLQQLENGLSKDGEILN